MTVEAVPRVDETAARSTEAQRKLMHTTMQTLGRVAIIGGSVLVALVNVVPVRRRRDAAAGAEGRDLRAGLQLALIIPVVSVSGVLLPACSAGDARRLVARA